MNASMASIRSLCRGCAGFTVASDEGSMRIELPPVCTSMTTSTIGMRTCEM